LIKLHPIKEAGCQNPISPITRSPDLLACYPSAMKKDRDAFGAELLAQYSDLSRAISEIAEREDGLISASPWPLRYFAGYRDWSKRERQAARLVKGRVLDVGCGAGRFALHLQKQGHEVTAIDNSPGAVKVSRLRGVKKALLRPIEEIGKFPARSFDSVIMMGNNFGLFGSFYKARRLLRDFARITSPEGQIIAQTMDPYQTKEPLHLAYHRQNRRRGRMAGQIRIRIRHGKTIGQWFDYLLVSQNELKKIVSGTAWQVTRIISDTAPGYTVVLKKRN
jgi:SAM-dependent methyltransferase